MRYSPLFTGVLRKFQLYAVNGTRLVTIHSAGGDPVSCWLERETPSVNLGMGSSPTAFPVKEKANDGDFIMTSLAKLISIGEGNADRLGRLGIDTPSALILSGASSKGRKEIADKTGLKGATILMWVRQAELFRLLGFSEQDANLLQLAGVIDASDLSHQQPASFYQTLLQVKQKTNTFYQIPTLSQLTKWIDQSKQMLRLITY